MQKRAVEIVDILDKKFNVDRDAQLNFTQPMEEIGELAKDINFQRLRHREPDRENMEGGFGDVFLQLSKMADIMDVDLEHATLNKIQTVKKRHESDEI